MTDDERTLSYLKRWQDPDGSWHITLTPHVLTVIPREVFKRFMLALYDMEQSLVDAGKEDDDEQR